MNKKRLDAVTTRSLVKQNNKRPGISFYIPDKLLINRKNPFIHGTLIIKKMFFKKLDIMMNDSTCTRLQIILRFT